ncbi:MAG: DUF1800 family protein [Pseudomonadota bacterium]
MNIDRFVNSKRTVLAVCAAVMLAAGCSGPSDAPAGGGGDENPPPTTPPTPSPPQPDPGGASSSAEASRFLSQATFGPSAADIDQFQTVGASAWMMAEFEKRHESLLESVLIAEAAGEDIGPDQLAETFWTRAIQSDDQLRQRVGFALSQILVASYSDAELARRPVAMANYMDIMAAGAFGNFRQTLENVTYSPAMAIYLTYLQNQKADEAREVVPDENYAREIMQLFTIGLLELQPNGEPRLDSSGQPIETYDNVDVTELAKVFTGLSWAARDRFLGRPQSIESEYLPLVMFDDEHSEEPKSFLGVTIPAGTGGERSIDIALDTLFNHPNTAPFISRQLIQRLVTSNPSPDYVARVANAFAAGVYQMPNGQNAGAGARGDMRAVVAAILFDAEARDTARMTGAGAGKLREPVLRFTHWARAFGVSDTDTDERDVDDLQDTRAPSQLNQQAYRSPSVFNFYRPGFVAPGSESADAGLVAPELQITTASSVTGYANFIAEFIARDGADGAFASDYTEEVRLAGDPAALVDHLDLVLAYNELRPETRSRAIEAVTAITEGSGGFTRDELRARVAILFIMTSSDYIVAR